MNSTFFRRMPFDVIFEWKNIISSLYRYDYKHFLRIKRQLNNSCASKQNLETTFFSQTGLFDKYNESIKYNRHQLFVSLTVFVSNTKIFIDIVYEELRCLLGHLIQYCHTQITLSFSTKLQTAEIINHKISTKNLLNGSIINIANLSARHTQIKCINFRA